VSIRFVTREQAISRYISPVLGEDAKNYDLDGIARDILRYSEDSDNIYGPGYMPPLETSTFWAALDRHRIK
jgi:hypothetical protein